MRSTLQRQFLVPVLAIVLGCAAGSALVTARLTSVGVRSLEQEHLRQVLAALTDANFPLTRAVLEKMSELSSASFVLLDEQDRLLEATLALNPAELSSSAALPVTAKPADLADQPRLSIGGSSYLAARLPRRSRTSVDRAASVVVLYPEDRWRAIGQRLVLTPLLISTLMAAILVITITWVARQVTEPIRRLRSRAAQIATGEFLTPAADAPPAVLPRAQELRDLTLAIEDMAGRLAQYADQIRRSERLRTLGQLGGGIAHQLRNSATGAILALDLHRRDCPLDPQDDSLAVATRQLKLLESHVQRFLAMSKTPPPEFRTVALVDVVSNVVPLVQTICEHAQIVLEFQRPAAAVTIRGDAPLLEQALVNLVLNAIEATRSMSVDRRITIAIVAASASATAKDSAALDLEFGPQLVVSDTGPGPQPAVAGQLFEPLVTDKPDGTGLGLTVARDIVVAQGGRLDWSRDACVTSFTMRFPARPVETPDGTPVVG